jgi:hypothetical protein
MEITYDFLSKFCYVRSEENNNPLEIDLPFNKGEYSYATNGHILVRVPKQIYINTPEGKNLPKNIEKSFLNNEWGDKVEFSTKSFSDVHFISHASEKIFYLKMGDSNFNIKYLLMIRDIEGIEFYPSIKDKHLQAYFKFNGGDGALMPCRI